ncbi:MAG: ABC transporter permease [Lachnospira sp.]|nr:ABC transporter permease [Lachnospira sp.]
MYYIKRFLRDVPTSLLIIFSFSLLLFMIYNVISIFALEERLANTTKEKYKYQVNLETSYITTNGMVDFDNELSKNPLELVVGEGNVVFESESIVLEEIAMPVSGSIVIQYNENFKYELKQGQYPIVGVVYDKPAVIIGKDIYDRIGNTNVLTVNGIECQIMGVLEKKEDFLLDERIIIFANGLSNYDKKEIINRESTTSYIVTYSSDVYDYMKIMQELGKKLNEYNFTDVIKTDNTNNSVSNEINKFMTQAKRIVTIMVIVFCLINCFVVTNLWIESRKKEISIRKSYGYDTHYIVLMIIADLMKYVFVSVVMALVMQLIYSAIRDREIIISYISKDTIYVLACAFVIVLFTAIMNVKKMARITPANSIKEVEL